MAHNKPIHNYRTFRFHCPVVHADSFFAVNIWRCRLDPSQRSLLETAIENTIFSTLHDMNVNFRCLDFGVDVTE